MCKDGWPITPAFTFLLTLWIPRTDLTHSCPKSSSTFICSMISSTEICILPINFRFQFQVNLFYYFQRLLLERIQMLLWSAIYHCSSWAIKIQIPSFFIVLFKLVFYSHFRLNWLLFVKLLIHFAKIFSHLLCPFSLNISNWFGNSLTMSGLLSLHQFLLSYSMQAFFPLNGSFPILVWLLQTQFFISKLIKDIPVELKRRE